KPSTTPASYTRELASPIAFSANYLAPVDNGRSFVKLRRVHPSVQHIDAWISSVGAGVALGDLYGTGRPADICLVDPPNNSVSIMPAPGTGSRYEPFALRAPTEGYSADTIAPMGCLLSDLNEDGRMDVLVYYWGRTPVAFIRNGREELAATAFTAQEI